MKIEIGNIAGIQSGTVTFKKGVNMVEASNFQGKSSLIEALKLASGVSEVDEGLYPLSDGKDVGEVTLTIGGSVYSVTLNRQNGTIKSEGNVLLTDDKKAIEARLFAFLGEGNPVRSAIRNADDEKLTNLLTQPLDTENIEEKINSLKQDRQQTSQKVAKIKHEVEEIPRIQESVAELEDKISGLEDQKEHLKQQLDETNDQEGIRSKLNSKVSEIEGKKEKRTRIQNRIKNKQSRLDEKKENLDEIDIPDSIEVDKDVEDIRENVDQLKKQITMIRDVVRINKQIIDQDIVNHVTEVDRSISGDTFNCWVCGNETDEEEIVTQIDALKSIRQQKQQKKTDLSERIKDIEQRKRDVEKKRSQQEELQKDIKQLEIEIEEDKKQLQNLDDKIDSLTEDIEDLRDEYEEKQDEIESELTAVQRQIGSKESTLTRKKNRLNELEEKEDKLDELQEKEDEYSSQIQSLRSRKEETERQLVEEFNSAMEYIVDQFLPGFESARIKRITTEHGDTDVFKLVVAREGIETSINRLSESEVELIGIAAAVAGYKTYGVSEHVPLVALDSTGGFTQSNIELLTEYLKEQVDYLITTRHPDGNKHGDQTVTPENWSMLIERQQPS